MIVKSNLAGLRESTWRENLIRFAGGGIATVVAGLVGWKWGAAVGGLFLAFPAIFPASVTLVEKHQIKRKREKGLRGELRGADVAAADAIGTALGSLGLLAFAMTTAFCIRHLSPWFVLSGGALVWFLVAFLIWLARKRRKVLFRSVLSRESGHAHLNRSN